MERADDAAIGAAAALELFQAAALAHDDLMDDSDTRRGELSAHRWFATQAPSHADPDARRTFGASGAILVGDLLLAASATVLHRAVAHHPISIRTQVDDLYAAMSSEVALGQYLDLIAAHASWPEDSGLERAWRVITAKTARYSVELPLLLGAHLADAEDSVRDWFTRLGREVGIAFQLRDDLLGVFGSPAITGKPAGDDLREGKRTVLIALAHQRADPAARAALEADLGRANLDADSMAALAEILITTGARDGVERLIAQHSEAAQALLENPPATLQDVTELSGLVHAAIDREA